MNRIATAPPAHHPHHDSTQPETKPQPEEQQMATATAISDQDAAQAAVDKLTKAIELLDQAGASLPQIKQLTRAAASDADCALMVATNELKLAQRDAS